MPTGPSARAAIERRTTCVVCGGIRLERAIELPRLPLTGLFSTTASTEEPKCPDQALLICLACGHGQLERPLDPATLYDGTYGFRTSTSATARAGTEFFCRFIDDLAPARRFRCALDLGCNDLHLLQRLGARTDAAVGVDPIWAGRDPGEDGRIRVVGAFIEDVDLVDVLPQPPDLIVCRHTLEHVNDPASVLLQLLAVAAEDALFVFEVPGFDALVRRLRFDQVFHQHLQYFHLASFQRLLLRVGARYLDSRENYQQWGALLVGFTPADRATSVAHDSIGSYTVEEIRVRYDNFRRQTFASGELLDRFHGTPIYGYGAAQMLPVLAYHLQRDLSCLNAIIDDDPAKHGLYYQNLPLVIRDGDVVSDWNESTVLLTAVDNARPILQRLLREHQPKHVLHPLHLF